MFGTRGAQVVPRKGKTFTHPRHATPHIPNHTHVVAPVNARLQRVLRSNQPLARYNKPSQCGARGNTDDTACGVTYPLDALSHGEWSNHHYYVHSRRVAALKAPRFSKHDPFQRAPPRGATANAVELLIKERETRPSKRTNEPTKNYTLHIIRSPPESQSHG